MATFKERLKELREEAGFTQAQLSEKLGISNGTIGNYEAGSRTPRFEDAENIADFFNVELDYLFGRTNERPEFSLEELWLIQCYRRADPDTKSGIRSILRKFEEKESSISSIMVG